MEHLAILLHWQDLTKIPNLLRINNIYTTPINLTLTWTIEKHDIIRDDAKSLCGLISVIFTLPRNIANYIK